MTAVQAWTKVEVYLKETENKSDYAPETIADCGEYFVFSIRPKAKPPGASTGINPYVVNKVSGKVVNDRTLKIVSGLKPIKMIDPKTIG